MKRNDLRKAFLSASAAAICSSAALMCSDGQAAAITLTWDNGVTGTAGYMVYCGEATRSYSSSTDVGSVTTIKVDGLLEGVTYFCAVTAYDASKLQSSYSNEVTAAIPYAAPAVAFSASPTSATAPASVAFSNTTTGQVTNWAWSFGDGGTSTEKAPTHTYSTAGDYWVTLTATGTGGSAAKTLSTAIKISAPSSKPGKGRPPKKQ